VQRLRENLDDLYIMSMPPPDLDLQDEVFMPNPIVVIAPTAHPLVRRGDVALHELSQHRFVLREKGSGTRMAIDQQFRRLKFRPDVRLELGSNEAIKESVAAGLGIGVVSQHALHGHQKEDGVAVVDVQGFPLTSAWHIVWPAARKLSPLASAFRQHLMREVNRRKWGTPPRQEVDLVRDR
jgi:LysR family transcriptional regulator, low CO2-responsive transcriptional regulator